MKNWKTTTLGIIGIITGLCGLVTAVLTGDAAGLALALPAIANAFGNVFSNDGSV